MKGKLMRVVHMDSGLGKDVYKRQRVVILEGALHYHYFYNDTSIVHKYDEYMYEGIRILTDTIKEIFMGKNISGWESQWD